MRQQVTFTLPVLRALWSQPLLLAAPHPGSQWEGGSSGSKPWCPGPSPTSTFPGLPSLRGRGPAVSTSSHTGRGRGCGLLTPVPRRPPGHGHPRYPAGVPGDTPTCACPAPSSGTLASPPSTFPGEAASKGPWRQPSQLAGRRSSALGTASCSHASANKLTLQSG